MFYVVTIFDVLVSIRLLLEDGCKLIQEVANLDHSVAVSEPIRELVQAVYLNPLAIFCVGVLLKVNLSRKETVSIKEAVVKLLTDIEFNVKQVIASSHHLHDFIATSSGLTLVTVETVIAMVMQHSLSNDQYLYHGFDLISTLKPGDILPQTLLARHFRTPYYNLSPIHQTTSGMAEIFNKQKSDLEAVKKKVDEFEPKGKAWSNKNLAEYIRKVEELFTTVINTVKEIYYLIYGELPALPEKPDGLDMFRTCSLLNTCTMEPGGK